MPNAVTPPTVSWTTEDLWNLLMREIEPDLCTDTMFVLNEIYSNETPEQTKVRIAWYEQAIDLFTERYQAFHNALKEEFQRAKKQLRSIAERGSDEGMMESAEAEIDSLPQV